MTPELSGLEMFVFGALGGAFSFLVIFAVPELLAAHVRNDFRPTATGIMVVFLLFLSQLAIGGWAAWEGGDAISVSQAVAYGTAATTLAGGGLRALLTR